ncbi:MAG: lipid-A-disaccharide synthase [Bacteroidia bacterium]
MKYFIVSGEASGDLHGSNLVKEIMAMDTQAEIQCWGGDLMQSAGATVLKHYRELAFMGFAEVLMNLRTILKNLNLCKRQIQAFKPDVVVLIDYPGFNLRIARFAFEAGFRVDYYISPQIWAWKQSRVEIIKQYVHRMMVILPFEKPFYEQLGYPVDFVGHPLLDAISNNQYVFDKGSDTRPIIALLPGSRRQEIYAMLPLMVATVSKFPKYRFMIAAAPSVPVEWYHSHIGNSNIELVFGNTYGLLSVATAALVTSGTATLETALFRVPQVVCYKGNVISYHIARKLIKVKFISLVNLIMDREVVKELIQGELNMDNLEHHLRLITEHTPQREKMLSEYDQLQISLGGSGASKRAASHIVADAVDNK